MIPWYQQGIVNVHAFAQPNYVITNLFGSETSPLTTLSPYLQTTQGPSQNPTPHFQIEAQIYHKTNQRAHEAEESPDDQAQERSGTSDQTKPRVFPVERFEPKQDAIVLNKAMLGTGTNEAQIIKVITKRSLEQRLVIAEIYKEMFGSDLSNDLRSETSGNFRRLLLALMTPLYQYYAKELHDAMSGLGTNEDILIEILCTLSNAEMEQVKKAYHNMFRSHLEEHIRDETSGHFKELLISLADRTDDYDVNSSKAKEQARRLHRAGELRLGTDESEFISLLSTQSFVQLNEIFFQYQAMTQHDIEDVISSEFSGDLKNALKTIVKVVRNKPLYFAEGLYKAMKGAGTNDKKLIRIMVTRGELDLGDIAEAFRMKYGAKLEVYVKSDTSGDYQRALLSLLGIPLHPTFRDLHDLYLYNPGSHVTGVTQDSVNNQQPHLSTGAPIAITSLIRRVIKQKHKETLRGANNKDINPTMSENREHLSISKDTYKNSNFAELLSYLPKTKQSTEPTFIVTRKTKSRKHKKAKLKKKLKIKISENAKSHATKTQSLITKSTKDNTKVRNDIEYMDF